MKPSRIMRSVIRVGLPMFGIGVLATWFAGTWKPKDVVLFCERGARTIYHVVEAPHLYVTCRELFSPSEKLVVAIANFYEISGTEREEASRLVNRLTLELKKHQDQIRLIDTLCAINWTAPLRLDTKG